MMKRRDFIKVLAVSAAWPALAAQPPALPVIGLLGAQASDPKLLAKFHQGLSRWGYREGRNVAIEYCWAVEQHRSLATLAAELARRPVALFVTTGGLTAAKAAKEATSTIPILFATVFDPVENGFLTSLNHPGGNVTGLSLLSTEVLSKRLQLLQQMVPSASPIAYLMNNDSTGLGPSETAQIAEDSQRAEALGLDIHYARNENDIEAAFATMSAKRTKALLVASDPFFGRRREMIVALAQRYALPAGYPRREFVDAGGLTSYGPDLAEAWREIGEYAGRILMGARPQELPVRLHDQYELVINMKTAGALDLTVPPLLHALADDTIE